MKTAKEIERYIKENPEKINALLDDLANNFETAWCEGMGTISNDVMNKVHNVIGWEPLE